MNYVMSRELSMMMYWYPSTLHINRIPITILMAFVLAVIIIQQYTCMMERI